MGVEGLACPLWPGFTQSVFPSRLLGWLDCVTQSGPSGRKPRLLLRLAADEGSLLAGQKRHLSLALHLRQLSFERSGEFGPFNLNPSFVSSVGRLHRQ
jgi:hypothetical protein